MLGQAGIQELLKRALSFSEADETEATIFAGEAALTRFASNIIHQNVAESDATITIRAVVGKRVGLATTNNLNDQGLAQATERALAHARQQPEDPDFPGLPEPVPVEAVNAYDDDTAAFTPEARAGGVGTICRLAAEQSLNAFGAFRTATQEVAIANSHGLMVYHAGTSSDLQTVVSGNDGSGHAQASNWRVREIDAESIGREAVEKAVRAQNPQAVEPGKYTIVVDPYVTEDLVNMLNFTGMNAEAVQEGRSWMNGRIGEQAMSPLVSIWDDGRDPAGAPLPFDFEGMPRQRVKIVDKGVICYPVYDRYTARKEGRETTGHASPPGMMFFSGPLALHLFMAPGDSSIDEMIQDTEKGLYITRFWYTRVVHPRDCVITGMTRDGVTMIENGQLTYPVKNLRFTQSYVEALANVQAVSRDQKILLTEWGLANKVPALKIDAFNFTGVTV
jgi:PmbA protein